MDVCGNHVWNFKEIVSSKIDPDIDQHTTTHKYLQLAKNEHYCELPVTLIIIQIL